MFDTLAASGCFRVAAVLVGLLPFVLIEVALRAFGLGHPSWHDDPFVGFSEAWPLFEQNEAGGRYEIARSKRVHFYPESFAVPKPPREFRIFCIGDSTVQGNPWTTETSFTTWLEISLNAAQPDRQWDVINCGGVSYASYRMVPILEEVLRHQPDLIIVHASHNEFLEDRTYGDLKQTPRWLWHLHEQTSRLRTFNLLRSFLKKPERSFVTNSHREFGLTRRTSDRSCRLRSRHCSTTAAGWSSITGTKLGSAA